MEIKYIEPSVLHDEMLRLRKEKQMDFLECLSGMDWGIPDEKRRTGHPPRTRRSLSVGIYCYRRTDSGTHRHSKPGNIPTSFRQRYLEKLRISTSAKSTTFTASFSSVIRICADSICAMTG